MPSLQTAWNAFWGIETKAAAPPMVPPPQVQSLVWSPSSYPDAAGDYWNPLIATASGSTTTWNSAVFACLALKAKAFQEAPLRIFRFLGDGTEEWLDDHPFMELVADPHPSLSQPEVNFWLSTCLDTAGEAFLRKIRNRAGGVVQLWPLSPLTVTPETTEPDKAAGVFISHYVVDDGKGSREEVPVEDVVHFRNGVDDTDHRRGMSPLRRLLREVASDEEATRFLEDLLANFAVASLAVTVPPGPVLTEEQAKQIRDRLREDYGGRNRNRGHVAVVANGATLSQVGFTPQQLDLKTAHYIPETRICLLPDTEIMTKRGLVPIAQVLPGDEVVTHRGRWRRVTQLYRNPSAGRPLVEVRANGFEPLRCTADHPVYAASFRQTRNHGGDLRAFTWKAAGALLTRRRGHRGDFDALTMPMVSAAATEGGATLALIEHLAPSRMGVTVQDDRLVHSLPHVRTLPAVVSLSPALGRLLGYYMAEGCQGDGKLYWHFAKHETAYQNQVLADLREVFGLTGWLWDRGSVQAVVVQSGLLARLFACGTARTKRVPAWVWDGDDDFREAVLEAWADGDGCRSGAGVRVSTRSRDLAWGMRLLALSVGRIPTLRRDERREHTLNGRTLPGGTEYTVAWHTARAQPTRYAIAGHHLVSSVRSVEPLAYDGLVYNLEVDDDHSYLTTGGMVHNCAVLGVPPTLVNLASGLEHTIYNNVRQGQEHFYEQTVIPLWRQVAATYTKQLLRPDYTPDRAIRLRYDLMDVRALQEDENEKWARLSVAVEKAWITKDEARAEVGLDPLPDGLGEAQDPLELLRQQAEISGPPAAGGRPGAQNGAAPAAKALEQKAALPAVNAIPAMQDVLTALTAPLVQDDLEAYFREQHERVVGLVTQAGLREG